MADAGKYYGNDGGAGGAADMFLPRRGEVSPQATEGEVWTGALRPPPPTCGLLPFQGEE